MMEKTMQDTTRTCGTSTTITPTDCAYFTVIYDYSEFDVEQPRQFPLRIRCRTCKQLFVCDYEESHCGGCVARRELTHSATL
jgi:hypothetical protein